jgi:hypothetical protein
MENHSRPYKLNISPYGFPGESLSQTLVLLVYWTRLPLVRIEHAVCRALVTRLVRVIATESLIPVRTGPGPGMRRAPQRKPEPVDSLYDFDSSNNLGLRTPAQNLSAEFGINGEKLSSCHV